MDDIYLCAEEDVLGFPGMPPCPHPDSYVDPDNGLTFCGNCLRRLA